MIHNWLSEFHSTGPREIAGDSALACGSEAKKRKRGAGVDESGGPRAERGESYHSAKRAMVTEALPIKEAIGEANLGAGCIVRRNGASTCEQSGGRLVTR